MQINRLYKHSNKGRFLLVGALLFVIFGLCAFSIQANSDEIPQISVVVSANNPIEQMSKKDIIDIYMGRFNTFPNGLDAEPIDLPDGSAAKQAFYQRLVGKDERKIKAYLSRLLFSGRAQPPLSVSSAEEVEALVTQTQSSIAYVLTADVTQEMKIVYQL
jgi:ABC-type phosphate transport system substrate-binding protein